MAQHGLSTEIRHTNHSR